MWNAETVRRLHDWYATPEGEYALCIKAEFTAACRIFQDGGCCLGRNCGRHQIYSELCIFTSHVRACDGQRQSSAQVQRQSHIPACNLIQDICGNRRSPAHNHINISA